jgi:hypothetical protein
MKSIDLRWQDLVTLANEGKVEVDEITVTVSRPLLPSINISVDDRERDYVLFAIDKTDDIKP